jgi:hypothetical protein
MLWVIDRADVPPPPTTTVRGYQINADGTLASPTTLNLPGFDLTPFIPPDSASSGTGATAVWLYQQSGPTLNLSVYPVNSIGSINGVALQTLSTDAILAVARGPATFAYGLASPVKLVTFTTAHDGTLTSASSVSLPPTALVGWSLADIVPEIGGTLDLFSPNTGSLLVFPVNSTGMVGSLLQEISPEGNAHLPQFPFMHKVDLSSGPIPPALTPLPTIWFLPLGSPSSSTIVEHAINSDGTIASEAAGEVPSPPNLGLNGAVVRLTPGQGLFSYGLDAQSGTIFGYGVGSSGMLNALGSFSGASFEANGSTKIAPFPPEDFTTSPIALFVENYSEVGGPLVFSGGTVTEYSLCAQGMPSSSTPISVIDVPFATAESYVVLSNGSVLTNPF